MIEDSEISFIIQGPFVPSGPDGTPECIASIREHFPGSPIIVSTWRDSGAADLGENITVIENDDPGATEMELGRRRFNNLNRQLVSTLAGLKSTTTRYAVKTRSNLRMTGRGFLALSSQYPERGPDYRVFEQRITACHYYFRNPLVYRAPMHPSDIFLFGLRQDLLRMWDIPLTPEPEFSRWFETRPRPDPDYDKGVLFKCYPEQYIWSECLKAAGHAVSVDSTHSRDPAAVIATEQSIVNNFCFDSPEALGVDFPFRLRSAFPSSIYRRSDYNYLYARHCQGGESAVARLGFVLRVQINRILFTLHRYARNSWHMIKGKK